MKWNPKMVFWTVVILTLLVFSPGNALAEAKGKALDTTPVFTGSDRGSFSIFSDGQLVGRETFQIQGDGLNFKASGETLLVIERLKEKVSFNFKAVLQFTKNFEPIAYQVSQQTNANSVRANIKFKSGASEVSYEIGKETDSRTIELKKDVVVLDDNVYHHYILLARRYDYLKGGEQSFSAFIPQSFMAGQLTVADKGNELTEAGPIKMVLQHLLVDTGDLQISLWVDPNHVLKKIAVPQSKVEVVRD